MTTHLGDAGVGGSSERVISSSSGDDDGGGGGVAGDDDVGVRRELEERGQVVLLRSDPVFWNGVRTRRGFSGGGEGEVVVVVDQALGHHLIDQRAKAAANGTCYSRQGKADAKGGRKR